MLPVGFLLHIMSSAKTEKRRKSTGLLATGYQAIRRGSLGIASHFVSEELKGFENLEFVRKIQIELADQESPQRALYDYIIRGKLDFDPIPFIVRSVNGSEGSVPLFSAEIRYDEGFVLLNLMKEELLTVVIPRTGGSDQKSRKVQ